jgi:hypothetical protein
MSGHGVHRFLSKREKHEKHEKHAPSVHLGGRHHHDKEKVIVPRQLHNACMSVCWSWTYAIGAITFIGAVLPRCASAIGQPRLSLHYPHNALFYSHAYSVLTWVLRSLFTPTSSLRLIQTLLPTSTVYSMEETSSSTKRRSRRYSFQMLEAGSTR